MPDLIDEAQEKQLADTEAALRAHHLLNGRVRVGSPKVCACGASIPLRRRKAQPGTRDCIDCALAREADQRQYRRVFA